MSTLFFRRKMAIIAMPASLLFGHAVNAAAAAGVSNEAPRQCPGVAAWYQAHPEQSNAAIMQRDAARTFSDPALRAELDERFDRDQAARIASLAASHNAPLAHRVMEIDADNVAWLFKVVQRTGFPTAVQVGEVGVRHVWLLAQHADLQPTFQIAPLPALE